MTCNHLTNQWPSWHRVIKFSKISPIIINCCDVIIPILCVCNAMFSLWYPALFCQLVWFIIVSLSLSHCATRFLPPVFGPSFPSVSCHHVLITKPTTIIFIFPCSRKAKVLARCESSTGDNKQQESYNSRISWPQHSPLHTTANLKYINRQS